MQQLQQLLWQLWLAVGWSGLSAIAALIVALDTLLKRLHKPPRSPQHKQLRITAPKKLRRRKRHTKTAR